MISMAGPLKDFVYIYEYRKIIVSIWMIILKEKAWRFIMPSYIYFRGLSRIKHVALKLDNGWIQMLLVWHVCQTHVTLGLANFQAQVCWVWDVFQTHASLGLVTAKPKCFGLDIFARPTLLWAWLAIKPKLDLSCLLDPRYLRLGLLLSPSSLGLACLPNPFYFSTFFLYL
jgi:hypothetical protein